MKRKSTRPSSAQSRKPLRARDRGRRSSPRMMGLFYMFMAAILVVGAGVGFTEIVIKKGDDSSAQAQALPTFVKAAPAATREAYLYAMERPDVLQYIPCYCGCGEHNGHKSNWNCFLKGQNPDGTFVFDDHGAG